MIRLGHLSNGHFQTGSNLLYFPQFDVIKQDVSDSINTQMRKTKFGASTLYGSNKAKISIEFDFVTEAQLSSLRELCLNSRRQLIFMKHPANSDQIIDYYGITRPSTTHMIYAIESDSADLDWGGTEISQASYNLLNDYPNNETQYYFQQNSKLYSYIFFKFDVGSYSTIPWQRLTLGLYNPYVLDGTTYGGYQIEAYNKVTHSWTMLSKANFTTPGYTSETGFNSDRSVFYSSLKSSAGFTKNSDYMIYNGVSNQSLYLRMRNIQPRVGILKMGIGYPHLLVDGFNVSVSSEWDFSFRSDFTGCGYTGSIEAVEL